MTNRRDLAGGAQSVDRALSLLALIRRHAHSGVGLSTVVAESGLNKPTARRLLLALIRSGLVEQDTRTRHYFLGEEAFVLGALASRRYSLLELASESVRNLAAQSEDTSFFSIRREGYSVCLHREEGAFPIRTHVLQAGYQHPLGVGAGSMALLAELADDEIERIIAANTAIVAEKFPNYTPEVIREHVALTRGRGWSLNPGLVLPNSWAVGIVARYPDGRTAGALSIAAIDSRLREERQLQLAELLKAEAGRLQAKLERMFSAAGSRSPAAGLPSERRAGRVLTDG